MAGERAEAYALELLETVGIAALRDAMPGELSGGELRRMAIARALINHPEIILAGRRMNDGMGEYVATETIKRMIKKGIQVLGSNILIMGFTFKENCPDVRNTRVIDIYKALQQYNVNVTVYDPWANPAVAKREYGIDIVQQLPQQRFDAVIMAVAHNEFKTIDIQQLCLDKHVIYDVKGILDPQIIDGRL